MNLKKMLFLMVAASSLTLPAFADEETNIRLKRIEEKQEEILARLTEIRSELDVIKVRATR